MSQHAAELCTLLVDEIYGELSSRVFTVLLRLGRLSLLELQRNVHLPVRQLKNGLAVLIQQHLVLYHTAPDEDVTFYEADWEAAYSLVRSGKVIMLVGDRFGETAAEVTSNLLLLGHATMGDLADAYSKALGGGNSGARNDGLAILKPDNDHCLDATQPSGMTLPQLDAAMSDLLQVGYVKQVREEHFRPATDNYNEAEKMFKATVSLANGTGTKAKAELGLKVRRQLERWRSGPEANEPGGHKPGMKRGSTAYGPGKSGKRQKLNMEAANGLNGLVSVGSDQTRRVPLEANLVVRVDYEKFAVAFRNQELVALANHKLGAATSLVYAELLQMMGDGIGRCRDEYAEGENADTSDATVVTISTLDLYKSFPARLDLSSDIADAPAEQIDSAGLERSMRGKKRRRLNHEGAVVGGEAGGSDEGEDIKDMDEHGNVPEVIQDIDESHWDRDFGDDVPTNGADQMDLSGERGRRIGQLKQHLQLLAEDSYHFIKLVGHTGLGEWRVDFRALVGILRQLELESIITERFGGSALRLVRILSEKGKLDEKQMSNLALIKQKEIRVTLTAMHEAGFLELQEVPRDNSRAPSRTIYLWFWDGERCRQLVLEDAYKAMARLLQRCAHERRAMRALLAKAERTDVKGNEALYLTGEERAALQGWREKEERLLAQVGRLDRAVGIFRDY
ncbi:MAG: RNA polymerase III subunit C82 [Thelocarpon impressellum]|nr:MAG: RNA polymerase III subunit C82 [Thelocarpon impressellum]